jgi:hypothetical protein
MPEAVIRPRRSGLAWLVLAAMAMAAGAWWYGLPLAWLPAPSPAPPPAAPPVGTAMAAALAEADEDAILALRPVAPVLLRLAGEPRVFVLVFPDLAAQAATMNRVAALVEKAGFARDRLATAEELARAIAARGDTPATWYLAHDYSAADLRRFFQLAASGAQPLSADEAWLQAQLPPLLANAGAEDYALLTLTANAGGSDEVMRAAVLRHEVAHGRFFTRPAFAARVMTLWREGLTAEERSAFTTYLAGEGYDTGNERLMANEAMAYLAFTPDPRLFKPEAIGFGTERAAALRLLYERALD